MYFHNSLIPRGAYFLLPLESKQEATTGWNFTKCISEVKVNQLKVKNMHVKMGISTFNYSPMLLPNKKQLQQAISMREFQRLWFVNLWILNFNSSYWFTTGVLNWCVTRNLHMRSKVQRSATKVHIYRLITAYLLLRVNLDKIMHARWDFDASSARTRRVNALDKHQNWSASALFG